MKQFINYFKALNYSPKPKRFQIIPIIAGFFLIYFNFIFIITGAGNIYSVIFCCLCSFVLLAGLILNNYFNSSPSLYTLVPISNKRSLVYRFLSVLLMFLLMVVVVAAFFAVIFLIGFLFSLIPACNGSELPADEIYADENVYYPTGLYGGLFFVAYFIIMYSAGMLIGLFKRRKLRNIFSICFCIGIFIAVMATITASNFKSPFINACYEAMALPWLCIAFWFTVAAAMLGWTIYMGIRDYNSKKF